jgi:lysozyme
MIDIPALHDMTVDALRTDEGYRAEAYFDTTGNLTIGYGWAVQICPMRLAEAELRLSNDVTEAISQLTKTFSWFAGLDLVRQSVLVNMVFNLGLNGLSKFKLTLQAIRAHDYETAAIEMLHSTWAVQVGARAIRLAREMKTGIAE